MVLFPVGDREAAYIVSLGGEDGPITGHYLQDLEFWVDLTTKWMLFKSIMLKGCWLDLEISFCGIVNILSI